MKKYYISDNIEDVCKTLKQFKIDDCLKRINRESVDFIDNSDSYELKVAKPVSVGFGIEGGQTLPIRQDIYITPWDLIDLAYYLILASDDDNGSGYESDGELFATYFAVYHFLHQGESSLAVFEREDLASRILLIFLGTVGEQIKFQRTQWIFDNMFRDIHMLLELNDSTKLDVEKILIEETGVSSWKTVVANLVRAYEAFKRVDTLKEILLLNKWSSDNERKTFEKLIRKYATDYEEVRKSTLGRQIFYKKPYVITQKGEIVSVNSYLNLYLCEHSIYWITRDYYSKQGRQDFTNYYGELFEKYLNEILSLCLSPTEYSRIDECSEKRADWKLNIGGYKFLVEQKSTLMRISAKQQVTDAKAIFEFVKRAIIPAMSQLECTEEAFNDGIYIKIILLYEDYFKSECLKYVMDLPECKINNDNNYWLVSIREMEMLLYAAKTNRVLFEEIIAEKIDRELHQNGEARGIIDIFAERGIHDNKYIREMKFVRELMESQGA